MGRLGLRQPIIGPYFPHFNRNNLRPWSYEMFLIRICTTLHCGRDMLLHGIIQHCYCYTKESIHATDRGSPTLVRSV